MPSVSPVLDTPSKLLESVRSLLHDSRCDSDAVADAVKGPRGSLSSTGGARLLREDLTASAEQRWARVQLTESSEELEQRVEASDLQTQQLERKELDLQTQQLERKELDLQTQQLERVVKAQAQDLVAKDQLIWRLQQDNERLTEDLGKKRATKDQVNPSP